MVYPRERNSIKSRPKRLAVPNYNINFIVLKTRILHFSRLWNATSFESSQLFILKINAIRSTLDFYVVRKSLYAHKKTNWFTTEIAFSKLSATYFSINYLEYNILCISTSMVFVSTV